MSLQPYLLQRLAGRPLCEKEATAAFEFLLRDDVAPELAGAFLANLHNTETVIELTAAAKVLRAHALAIAAPKNAIDTCGTGGDMAGTYNISTACAFIVAGAGVPVAKHGNRAASSQSGAADVLEALGVNIALPPARVEAALAECGIAFLFAQTHHPALRHLGPIRKTLGFRTIFNMLGPLVNPAGIQHQLLGVGRAEWLEPMAQALKNLGAKRAWLVHSEEGLDELSITHPSRVYALDGNSLKAFVIAPQEYGFATRPPQDIRGGTPQENAQALKAVLDNTDSAYRDMALLNSAAALVVARKCKTLKDGIGAATQSLASGAARARLDALIAFSNAATNG